MPTTVIQSRNPRSLIERYFLLIALVFAMTAIWWPGGFTWSASAIRPMLGVIMFGMGVTVQPRDFLHVRDNLKAVGLGVATQYLVMPIAAVGLSELFGLSEPLLIGFVLLGACPGGTASNVMTYLARGHVALSVAMTLCSTLLSPLLTPMIVYSLVGHRLAVPFWPMVLSIGWVVLLPVLAGVLVRWCARGYSRWLLRIFPSVSMLLIIWVIAIVLGLNQGKLLSLPVLVALVVVLHNLTGLLLGYLAGWLMGCNRADCRTLALEVGMQNSGLGVALAGEFFAAAPLVALPSALFSLWHNISGIVFASLCRLGSADGSEPSCDPNVIEAEDQ